MTDYKIQASQVALKSITEKTLGQWLRDRGTTIVRHNERDWIQTIHGFYEPLHWMARLSAQQVTSPTLLSWGFRACLLDQDASAANATLPIYWLPDLENYDEERLSANRRRQLRKCHKRTQIVQLTEPDILREEGYEVLKSALMRTKHTRMPTKAEYLAGFVEEVARGQKFVLAGLVNGKLGGYVAGRAVAGIAYLDQTVIATEAMESNIGIGLVFEFAQAARRSGEIAMLVNGLHCRESPSLHTFKADIGFRVQLVPAIARINPIMQRLIRWRYPHKYYRLTGEG